MELKKVDTECDQMAKRQDLKVLGLSRTRILRSAMDLADQDGLEGLSMRKVAQGLEVQAMSLYNHVANKEDLIDGMVELVVGEMAVPQVEKPWKEEMRRRAIVAHEVLLRHPWALIPLMSRVNVGPMVLQYIDATLGCLHAGGFSLFMADHAWNAMDSHIYGFTLQELKFPFEPEDYAVEAAKMGVGLISAQHYPHMNWLMIEVMERRYDGLHDFEFGLEMILVGLERVLEESL
jgi:AcrR family transcriptional regulator